jgi:hypothetical protein
MAIEVSWHNPETLYIRFAPGWTWDDLRVAGAEIDRLIVEAGQTVHLLIDMREAGGLPRDFMQVAGELLAQGEARPNEGHRIIVGAGRLMRAAYSGLRRVYALDSRPLLFAGDIHEAQQLIAANP